MLFSFRSRPPRGGKYQSHRAECETEQSSASVPSAAAPLPRRARPAEAQRLTTQNAGRLALPVL